MKAVLTGSLIWFPASKTPMGSASKVFLNFRDPEVAKKTLLNSYHAKLIAVRRISQDNQGRKTAGVDGVKSLTPKQRLKIVNTLKLNDKSKPVRRVWIPKSNGRKRPLGIPVMHDRAKQALVKAALEPEWEALFEPNSFGFRPGRSCHDAVESIFNAISVKTKQDLVTIKRYKFRKGWEKVHKKFQRQFEKSHWIWNNDLPTLV